MEEFEGFDEFNFQDDPEMQRVIPFDDLEKELYVDRLTIEYNGPFDLHELRMLLHDWAKGHSYAKDERDAREVVKENGKDIYLVFRLQRWVSHKYLVFMNILMDFVDVTDMEVERDGKRMILQNGKVKVVINGFLGSWGEKHRWEVKIYFHVIREIIDKFVYKIDRGKYSGMLMDDVAEISRKIKAVLNMNRFKVPRHGGSINEEIPGAQVTHSGIGVEATSDTALLK